MGVELPEDDATPPVRPAPRGTRSARILRWADARDVPLLTILVTVGTVVVVYLSGRLLYRLRDIVVLILAAGFISLVLNPLVAAVQRRVLHRRGAAVALVTLWFFLVFAALAVAFGYPLVNGVTHLANDLPQYVSNAQHGRGWLGRAVSRYHLETWVHANAPKLVSLAGGLSSPALTLGRGALSVVLKLVTTFALVVLMLLEAPKIRVGVLALMSPERAERSTRVGRDVSRAITPLRSLLTLTVILS